MLRTKSGYLAYIDFGLVSEVPESVRESIVCALVHLIHGEYTLLAESFSGLELMRSDDVEVELPVLAEALREAFEPATGEANERESHGVRRFRDFTLVGVATKLLMLGTRFPFVFRDYFLNNLRCLGMLEGLALNADPNFSVLCVVYPYVAKKILVGSTPRYRNALESLVIDSYGRMRWSRIDQLLHDVQATAATAKIGPVDSIMGQLKNKSKMVLSTNMVDDGAVSEDERTARLVLQFITSDTGRFLRRYIVQRYLLSVELGWRRRIDIAVGTINAPGRNNGLVNATSALSRDAATRWLALQATVRELSDDEARVRTRQFFRSTGFITKVKVFMRLLPSAVIPWLKTMAGLTTYAFGRLWQSLSGRGHKAEQEINTIETQGVKNGRADSNLRVGVGEQTVDTSYGSEVQNAGRKWRGFDSNFARRAREIQISGRRLVTKS